MKTKKIVTVTQEIEVTIDESKFTPEFMQAFKESFYDFATLDQHRCHLAQLYARGIYDDHSFIEGYGQASSMGISFRSVLQEEEVMP